MAATDQKPRQPPIEAVKRAVIGRPRATAELGDTLLSKFLALPIFSADPLSSVAYATEAALVVLVGASAGSAHLVWPISIAISVVLAIVVISYTQTVQAYESSGGAYVVAKENLGTLPSLVAAAALLVDYVLTVSVSVAAGVLAITSAAPSLRGARGHALPHADPASHGRQPARCARVGVRVRSSHLRVRRRDVRVIVVGIAKCADGTCPTAHVPNPIAAGAAGGVGVFVILRAFASGSAALTGVESISNGVNAFRPPQGKNAARTLLWMGGLAISLFLGVSWLAVHMHASPSETVSVVSEIARGVFPTGSTGAFMYYAVQGLTFAVLVLAANTSYQGFPRLSAVLARDRFFPRQFVNLGDRLVYSNGIIVLAALASLLIWAFNADVNALIHLYVIGVFTAFTLSQAGMVRYWQRNRQPGWRRKLAINGAGAVATAIVAVLVIETKFLEGAWAVAVAIPLLVAGFYGINGHYRKVARRLRAGLGAVAAAPPATNQVVLYVESYGSALREALWYANQIAGDDFRAIHVPGPHTDTGIRPRFRQLTDMHPDLEIVQPEGSRVDAVIDELWAIPRGESSFVTAIIPEEFKRASLVQAIRRRTEFSLKVKLLTEPGVVISDVPVISRPQAEWRPPERAVCRVLASGAHAATLRAVHYAGTLGLEDTRAVYFATDEEDADRMRVEWDGRPMRLPLEIQEAHYRDLGDPLLATCAASRPTRGPWPWSSCRSSSSAGRSGCCTISALSTSSACSSSSRA
jgi:amino acid transporter